MGGPSQELGQALLTAAHLIASADPQLLEIVAVSFGVSITALILATPWAIALAYMTWKLGAAWRRVGVVVLQALVSFPTVVVGLVLYLILSRAGPLGAWHWLYTTRAMALGQFLIAIPVIGAFALSAFESVDVRITHTAIVLGAGRWRRFVTLARECRFALMGAVVQAFGRVVSEVGCALMVGGNIAGATRNITTAIALETSKGDFAQGIALGIVLIAIALGVNVVLAALQGQGRMNLRTRS